MKSFLKTKELTLLALLCAITILMVFTPLGMIPTPFLNISLLCVPVSVGASILGKKGGVFTASIFGLGAVIITFMGKDALGAILLEINVIGLLVTALLTRVLMGLFSALFFKAVKKLGNISYFLTGFFTSLCNTVLFMSSLMLFFWNDDYIQGLADNLNTTNPLIFVLALVGVQAVVEAIVCTILGGSISLSLKKVVK